jgi:hypothetical protein
MLYEARRKDVKIVNQADMTDNSLGILDKSSSMKLTLILVLLLMGVVATEASCKTQSTRQVKRVSVPLNQRELRSIRQGEFSIDGRVVNSYGGAEAGARVFADLDSVLTGMIMETTSDSEGHFSIPIRSLGNYTVYGSKEEDGYPLTISGFHQQVRPDQIPRINVTEPKTVTDVTLQLGDKAATLDGNIEDGDSDQAVQEATIILRRTDNPALLYRTSSDAFNPGQFKVVVPTAPFTIEIESQGYEPWKYQIEGLESSLKLARGESKHLFIKLRKQTK